MISHGFRSDHLELLVLINEWTSSGPGEESYRKLERLERTAELCTKLVRHLGVSWIAKPLVDLWLCIRRTLCALSGMDFNAALSIRAASIGLLPNEERTLTALRELVRGPIMRELSMSKNLLEEILLLAPFGSEIEEFLMACKELLTDARLVMSD